MQLELPVSRAFPDEGEARLRRRWRKLVDEDMPAAAAAQRWPVRLNHCFARILLDCACGRPWRETIRPPAWRNAPETIIERTIDLGEACLSGREDLRRLNRLSLQRRGRWPSGAAAKARERPAWSCSGNE